MPDDPAKRASGGILGLIGLPPAAVLLVAGLTLALWWYYAAAGERLSTAETAAVVIGLAILVALCLTVWRLCRRVLARPRPPGNGSSR